MNGKYLRWLLFAWLVVITIWGAGLAVVYNAKDWLGVEFQVLPDLPALGDSFGTLNSLFTGLALAAIVVAIFMQAKQLDEQVTANELYKEEVSATLDNLRRENAWKIVESKMNLIPLLSESYTRQLLSLAKQLKTRSLDNIGTIELYKDREAIDLVCEAIGRHEAIMRQQRESLNERMSTIKNEQNELSVRLEEVKDFEGDTGGLQKTYGELLFKLLEESKSVKSELAKHEADNEVVLAVHDVVTNIRKLNHEFEVAFQKAYQMTS